jgi:hypothetical protein
MDGGGEGGGWTTREAEQSLLKWGVGVVVVVVMVMTTTTTMMMMTRTIPAIFILVSIRPTLVAFNPPLPVFSTC